MSKKYLPFKNNIVFYEHNWPYTSYFIIAGGRIKLTIGLAWATYGIIAIILATIGIWIAIVTPYAPGETVTYPYIDRFWFILGSLWFILSPIAIAVLIGIGVGIKLFINGWSRAIHGVRKEE